MLTKYQSDQLTQDPIQFTAQFSYLKYQIIFLQDTDIHDFLLFLGLFTKLRRARKY